LYDTANRNRMQRSDYSSSFHAFISGRPFCRSDNGSPNQQPLP
jgi:hypothetical protein